MDRRDTRWLRILALMAALVLAFAACGEDEEPTTPGAGDGDETEAPAGDFTLVSDGTLTVGSDIPYPPFEFQDDAGTLTGFDVDIVREIANRLGVENPDDAWISTDFGTIFQQLSANNRFDIVVAAVTGYAPDGSPASETVAERTAVIDFTVPYYPSLQSLTVDTSKSDVTNFEDLPEGARVAVQSATTGAFFAKENLEPLGVELVEFNKAPQMYQQLQGGGVDAVFNDLPVSLDAISDFPDLQVVQQVETGEEYAIAVSKDNPALTEAINGVLEEMFADGTYAQIFLKYFPDQDLPSYASE
jgi:polar amino acid transport system substrate-binding protein